MPTLTPTPSRGSEAEVVNIIQHENPYFFEPATFNFEVNKTYVLIFAEVGEFHTFTVRDLGIDIFVLPGEAVQVDITPTKVGTFQLICVPHEGLGEVGVVDVHPATEPTLTPTPTPTSGANANSTSYRHIATAHIHTHSHCYRYPYAGPNAHSNSFTDTDSRALFTTSASTANTYTYTYANAYGHGDSHAYHGAYPYPDTYSITQF